jgi:hypothetical protein
MNETLYDLTDAITVRTLKEWRSQWKEDLTKENPMIFDNDPKVDKKIIRRKIKAINEILEYAINETQDHRAA